MATSLSPDARYLRMYRAKPSIWVAHHLDVKLARYRSQAELEAWLDRLHTDSEQRKEMHRWCRSNLAAGKLTLDSSRSYQGEMLDAMAQPGYYAFQCANGTAKTATAAIFAHWFLDCYPGAKLLTTAGTWSQLREQLWREIATWGNRTLRPIATSGRVNKTQIDIAPDWAAFGRTADRAETFEGVHGNAVAVLMDEAKAIPPGIFDAVRRILRGNPGGRFWWIALSSPGSPSGPFYDITQGDQAHRWTTFKLSAYESERIDLDQLEADRQDLNETSPLYVAMDLGEWPEEGEDVVIPLSWAQAAVDRTVATWHGEGTLDPSKADRKTLGVDVARFGGDETAMVELIGRRAEVAAAYQGRDTVWTEGRIHELWSQRNYDRIGIDDTGLVGVTDHIQALGLPADGISFGSTEGMERPEYYANIKAEMYFKLRAELDAGRAAMDTVDVGLSIPNDKKLIHQLTMQRYRFTHRRQYQLESHEELKKRGERSPDRADALALANLMRSRGVYAGLSPLPDLMPR